MAAKTPTSSATEYQFRCWIACAHPSRGGINQGTEFMLWESSRSMMRLPVLDPELLTAFVAVAEHKSFTRAAAALNRTQSAISMQIKRLEDRLGVELFRRSKLQVELSPAGEGLLGYAQRILTLNDEAIGRLRERQIEGVVRLGVMDDYGTFLIP